MGNLSFLITDLIILSLQIACATCNGFALFMYFRVKRLRRNLALRMVLYLCITDTLLAVTARYYTASKYNHNQFGWTVPLRAVDWRIGPLSGLMVLALPHIIYFIALWNDYLIILNPYMVMISSTPLVIQLKINLTLTIAIALDRTIALYFMVIYRRMSPALYANISLLIGVCLGCCDVAAEFVLSPILYQPNCAAIGCFVSNRFRYYWGTSNMALGFLVILLTIVMLVKLRYIQRNSASEKAVVAASNSNTSKFKQANRSSVGILLTSLLFVTLPSVGVGIVEMIGFSIFKAVGPFYILGVLSAGTCNCIVYFVLNRDLRMLAKNFILRRPYAASEIATKTATKISKMNSTVVPL